jgi:hypothetical protein
MEPSTNKKRKYRFSASEIKAIEMHKYFLSQKAGYDVGEDFAIKNWLEHHSHRWQQDRLRQDMEEQRLEILKHKWIESEKAGDDVGKKAAIEWINKYAEKWRKWKDSQEKQS